MARGQRPDVHISARVGGDVEPQYSWQEDNVLTYTSQPGLQETSSPSTHGKRTTSSRTNDKMQAVHLPTNVPCDIVIGRGWGLRVGGGRLGLGGGARWGGGGGIKGSSEPSQSHYTVSSCLWLSSLPEPAILINIPHQPVTTRDTNQHLHCP